MTPDRYWELDDYFTATTQGLDSTVTPPTSEEIAEFSTMEPPPRPSQDSGTSTSSSSRRNTTGSGAEAPQEQGSGVKKSSSSGSKTTGSGPTEAHGANLPRDTAATRDARQAASSGAGTTTTASDDTATDEVTEPTPARSLWSQALRDERDRIESVGGTMRDFRMPFEQHPQSGVFANFQAVAQPGMGPAVPNRMPGQPPAPAPFPQGPMPMANGLPQRGPAPAAPPMGAPPPGTFARPPMAPPMVQQQIAQAPINNFSQRLQQMGAQPVMPQQAPPPGWGAPQMPQPSMMMPEPRPMQSSFGRTMPSPDFSNSVFAQRDPFSGY